MTITFEKILKIIETQVSGQQMLEHAQKGISS